METAIRVRAAFRQLVSALHPDRATGPADAKRRTALMQRANRLRAEGDLAGLQALLRSLAPPAPAPAPAALPRAADVNPWALGKSVLTQDGWVAPAR